METEKKLFKVSFEGYSDKDMYIMASSFDDAERIAIVVKEEEAIQKEEQKEIDAPVIDDDGSLYKERKSSIITLFDKEEKPVEVNSVTIVTKKVYGLETNGM